MQLLEGINICSSAFRRGKYQQKIIVGAQTERAVSFIVIPLKFGEFPIAVKAAVKDSLISDGVQKMLRVVVREENLQAFFFGGWGLHLILLKEMIRFEDKKCPIAQKSIQLILWLGENN